MASTSLRPIQQVIFKGFSPSEDVCRRAELTAQRLQRASRVDSTLLMLLEDLSGGAETSDTTPVFRVAADLYTHVGPVIFEAEGPSALLALERLEACLPQAAAPREHTPSKELT